MNINGGEIAIRKFNDSQQMDDYWELLSVYCVSEKYDINHLINGIRIVDSSIRNKKLHRIELWFNNYNDVKIVENFFRKIFNIHQMENLHIVEHKKIIKSKYQNNQNNNKRYIRGNNRRRNNNKNFLNQKNRY